MIHSRFVWSSIALLAVGLLVGCGEAGSPPPGATSTTSPAQVELGNDAQAQESGAAAAPAAVPETKTALAEGELATLTGRIVYDGKPPASKPVQATKDVEVCGKHEIPDETLQVSKDGGLADAVVSLKTKNVPAAPSYAATANEPVVLDNKDCRFQPHVAIILTSQELQLKNSDPVGHNSKMDPFKNLPINPILPAGGEPTKYKFKDEEGVPVKVGCNIHPWMGAYLIVRKDPYAAITDKDGKFTIKDLPAGKELEFHLWQESAGHLKNAAYKGGKAGTNGRFKIKLKPGVNDLGDIKVSASTFKK
ncbi:MAG: hypothetical protein AB7O59_05015 [Pirellulales bacterium]